MRGIIALLLCTLACVTLASVTFAPVALAQTAPAPAPAKKPPAKPSAIKPAAAPSGPTVCVASAIGHKFRVQKIGVMVFGNGQDDIDVPAWGIDDAVLRAATTLLARHSYAARRLTLSAAQIDSIENPPRELFHDYEKDIATVMRAAAAGARCDFSIAITRTATAFSNTNQSVGGLGILQLHAELVGNWYLYAVFGIRLYDANFERKAYKLGGYELNIDNMLLGNGIRGVSRHVDKSWWPEPPQAAAQNTRLRDAMRDMTVQGLAISIPKLFETQ